VGAEIFQHSIVLVNNRVLALSLFYIDRIKKIGSGVVLKAHSASLSTVTTYRLTQSTYYPSQLQDVEFPGEVTTSSYRVPSLYEDVDPKAPEEVSPEIIEELGRWMRFRFFSDRYIYRAILNILFGARPFQHNYNQAPCVAQSVDENYWDATYPKRNYWEYFQYPPPHTDCFDTSVDQTPHRISLWELSTPLRVLSPGLDLDYLSFREVGLKYRGELKSFEPPSEYVKSALEVLEGGTEFPLLKIKNMHSRKIPPPWTSPVTYRVNDILRFLVKPKDLEKGDLLFVRNMKFFGVFLPQGWEVAVKRKLESAEKQDTWRTRKNVPFGYLNGSLSRAGRRLRVKRLQRLIRQAFEPSRTLVAKISASDLVHADFKSEMFRHHLKAKYGKSVSFLRFRLVSPWGGISWYFFILFKTRPVLPQDFKYLKNYLNRSWEYREMQKKFGICPFWVTGKDKFYKASSRSRLTYLISLLGRIPLSVFAVLDVISRFNKRILLVDNYTVSRDLDPFLKRRRVYTNTRELYYKGLKRGLISARHREAFFKKKSYRFEPAWFHRRFPYTGFGFMFRVATGADPPSVKYNGVISREGCYVPIPECPRGRFNVYVYDKTRGVLILAYFQHSPDLAQGGAVPSLNTLRTIEKIRKVSPPLKVPFRERVFANLRYGREKKFALSDDGNLVLETREGRFTVTEKGFWKSCYLLVVEVPSKLRLLTPKIYWEPRANKIFFVCLLGENSYLGWS